MPLLSLLFIISFNPGDLDAWEQSKPRRDVARPLATPGLGV